MTYSLSQKTLKNLEEIGLDLLRKPKNPQVKLATCDTTNETFSQMPSKSPRNHLQITYKSLKISVKPNLKHKLKPKQNPKHKQNNTSPTQKNISQHREQPI
jgi:hypothetical protein